MRAHWLDFGIVALVVFLEFKGYFPTGPYHTIMKLFNGGLDMAVKAPTEGPLVEVNQRGPVVKQEKAKMSSTVKQIIAEFISSNKIAVNVVVYI